MSAWMDWIRDVANRIDTVERDLRAHPVGAKPLV